MPLFGKSAKPFIDHARGDAEASRLRAVAASGSMDWKTIDAAIRATSDAVRREFLVDAVASHSRDLRWVDAWIEARPDDELGRLMWGACAHNYAFEIRTAAIPESVSGEQWKGFGEWLVHSEEQLRLATTMDPADSAPWVGLLWTAVGLGPPLREVTSRWEAVSRLNPQSEVGAGAYMTFISPRWHGNTELMWDWLHGLLAAEPDGGARWPLVPNGHFEQWVAESMDKNPHAKRYWDEPEVQREINEAWARWTGAPAPRTWFLAPWYWEVFAGAFYLMRDREKLRKALEKTGPGIQPVPWAYLGPAVEIYQKVRESVGLR